MAIKVQETLSCSGRSVCRWLGLNRSTMRYVPRTVPEKKKLLESEIVKMSKRYPCFGYRKITRKLIEQGWGVGKSWCSVCAEKRVCKCLLPSRANAARGSLQGFPKRQSIVIMSGPGTS